MNTPYKDFSDILYALKYTYGQEEKTSDLVRQGIFLIENGLDLTKRDEDDNTYLHTLASFSSPEIKGLFQALIKADRTLLTQQNDEGKTPLHLVHDIETARLFIESGSDILAKDDLGNTPLHCIIEKMGEEKKDNLTALSFPERFDPLETVRFFYKKGGLETLISENNKGQNPLHIAFLTGAKKTIDFYFSLPIDFTKKDVFNNSYLHYAIETPEFLPSLIEKGLDVNAPNVINSTPLLRAVKKKNEASVRILLTNGADASLENHLTETPFKEGVNNLHVPPSLFSMEEVYTDRCQ